MAEIRVINGEPVVVKQSDYPRNQTFRIPPKDPKALTRAKLKKKGLLGKIPKGEQRLLTMQQRDALANFIMTGLDPAKTYFETRFKVRDAKNLSHDFRWRFQPGVPVFRDFLVAVGGKGSPTGASELQPTTSGKP